MTTTPVLPVVAGYGVKSDYGFDPKDGHKLLIGVSVGKPGSWAANTVELFTADQMRNYALAAIAAAQAAQPREDGMPSGSTERHLRRLLCVQRHGWKAYMDDGEASYCGDAVCRGIDYMRETPESIEKAWTDAGAKMVQAAQPTDADKADAERYRFASKNLVLAGGVARFGWPIAPCSPAEWNRYIDAAIAASKVDP